ncbi:hypothetical protein FOA52_001620 [Chlamydomonas sp. UWO 241]|nr:hypothetical protein FOA52_001620 [Chlamydomonas sp. UWO 241]
MALDSDGNAHTYGGNSDGELGINTTIRSTIPVLPQFVPPPIIFISGDISSTGNITSSTGISGPGAGLTDLNAANISTGTLAVAQGGTGTTTSTGSGRVVLDTGATFAGETTFAGHVTTSAGMTINGDLVVAGSNFITTAETVEITDNTLLLNAGEVGTGVTAGFAGLEIDRGVASNYLLVFDESADMFRVGAVGSLETLASQPYVAGYVEGYVAEASNITSGILAVQRGGTGTVSATGTGGSVVLSVGPTLTGTTTVATLAATTVQFPNTLVDKKLVLWDGAGAAYHGLGIAAGVLKYNVATSSTAHVFTASNVELMRLTGTGNVGVGTSTPAQKLHVVGNIFATGDVVAQSDARLKTDITPIDNAMARIGAISGYTYRMTDDESGRRCLGVLAQEVKAVMPEAVVTPPTADGFMSVAYGNLVALLIEGMKELGARIDRLEG